MALLQVQQQAVQPTVGGLVGATTGTTGGLTGISGRHLLQSTTPAPVTTQVTNAVTDAGNMGVSGASQGLQTLELVPESKTRHLLQATPAPETGIAQLVNTVRYLHLTCMTVFVLVPGLTESVRATALGP